VTALLEPLIASSPLALALLIALRVVWSKYQDQLDLNRELTERHAADYRRLAGLDE
jgi:hypothetical protein